jgi:hypothetical protein
MTNSTPTPARTEVEDARLMLRRIAAEYGLDHTPPLYVTPNQAAHFKTFGLEEGRDYIVQRMLPND